MTDANALSQLMDMPVRAQSVDLGAIALAWLLAHPAGTLPVMGTNRLEHIATLRDAFRVAMDGKTWFELYEAANGHGVP